MGLHYRLTLGALVAGMAGLCSCAGAGDQASPSSSDDGAWIVTGVAVGPVRRGSNDIAIEARLRANGEPVAGAMLEVTAIMPAMAHGAAAPLTVRELGAGRYVAEGVVFHMPGLWQVRIQASDGTFAQGSRVIQYDVR